MRCGKLRYFFRLQYVYLALLCSSFDVSNGQNVTSVEQFPILQSHSRRLSGHAYISLKNLEQSDGPSKNDEAKSSFSVKVRDTESDRPKKTLLRAAEQPVDDGPFSKHSQKAANSTTSHQTKPLTSSLSSKSKMLRGEKSKPRGSLEAQQKDNSDIATLAPASSSILRGVGLPKHPSLNEDNDHTVKSWTTATIKANSIDVESNRDNNGPSPIQPQLDHESVGSNGEETDDGSTTYLTGRESLVSVLIKTRNKHKSHSSMKEKGKAGRFKSYGKSNKKSYKNNRFNDVDYWLRKQHGTGTSSTSEYYEDNDKVGDGWLTSPRGKATKGSKASKSKKGTIESRSKRIKTSSKKLKGREKTSSSSKTPLFAPIIREKHSPTARPSAQPVGSTENPTVPPSRFTPSPSSAPTVANFPTFAPSYPPLFTSTPNTGGSTISPTSKSSTISPTATPNVANVPTNAPSTEQMSAAPVGIPTLSPFVQETQAPIVTSSGAPNVELSIAPSLVPMSAPSAVGQVDASPFNLVYGTDGQPTEADLLSAGALTVQYLEDFFTSQFSLNSETELVAVTGTVTSTDVTQSLVAFDLSLTFSENSVFVPTSSDVDNLLFAAFQPPFVDGLLTLLATDLPSENAVSTTMSVQYSKSRR